MPADSGESNAASSGSGTTHKQSVDPAIRGIRQKLQGFLLWFVKFLTGRLEQLCLKSLRGIPALRQQPVRR